MESNSRVEKHKMEPNNRKMSFLLPLFPASTTDATCWMDAGNAETQNGGGWFTSRSGWCSWFL